MFHRNGSSNPLTVTVQGAPDATVELDLQGDLMEGFSTETLQPQPVRVTSAGRGLKLWLQTDAQGRASIYLTLRGDGLGRFSSTLSSPGSATVDITQFIFP